MSEIRIQQDPAPPAPIEVADRVFAYVQPDGTWWVNTTGFVLADGEVAAVDACATERRTRALLDAIGTAAGGAPVRTLINTHFHGDHTYGNSLFTDATILGHVNCRAALLADTMLENTPPVWEPMPDWGNVVLTPPTVTFDDQLTVHVGDVRLELRHPGVTAHTNSDVVVWIPERSVLFTGDLAFHGGTPMMLMGSVAGSIEALDFLRSFPAETVVPGHGAPTTPALFDTIEGYCRLVWRSAEQGRAAGLTPLEVAREVDLGEFAELSDRERIVLNLHRAYAEQSGEQVSLPTAFADVLAYNQGRRLRCVV